MAVFRPYLWHHKRAAAKKATTKRHTTTHHNTNYGTVANLPNTAHRQGERPVAEVQAVLGLAWAPGTMKGHTSGIRQFVDFCRRKAIPRNERFPVSETLLCRFAASYKGIMTADAVRNKLYGVRTLHIFHNLPYNDGILLKYTLEGIDKATPESSRKPPRPPITIEMITMLHDDLDLFDNTDSAVLALATTAFFGQIRLGELFPDAQDIRKFKGKYNPVLKDLAQPHSAHGSRKLHLPWTKTKKNRGEDVILCKQNGAADPINAMLHHIHKNRLSENSPIASYIAPNGQRMAMTAK
ncbi:hypothetical protein ARMSODRAFT_1052750 [Armillaria solidipes]|uniref:Core-binding (CB) domain-containing protein n=1 Tax=Armillaria solidipes TaxID=1076256 RepID=A0A2H3B8R8_9AGAR|nr:hypothetical protein ARMSODRAFT_1052750 [Armillaria solidipes]